MVQSRLDKVEKLSYKSLFTIIVVLLIGIVGLLRIQQRPTKIFAEWFDDAWNYRQAINISAHSVGETNVYISASVNIGSTAKSQPDNGDFRFTTTSGQLLDYYIVSGAGTTNVSFHINFDSFPAGAQTIYAYYGNLSVNNGFKTSDFSTAASGLSLGSNTSEEVGGGPVSWYKLDEGNNSTIHDSTQNNLSGTLGSGSSSPTWLSSDSCIFDKCLQFDGNNDYINVGDNLVHEFPNSNSFSISFWVYSPLTSTGTILAKKTSTGAGTSGYDIRLSSSGTLDVYFSDGTDQYQLSKSSTVASNTWTYLTIVFDNNSTTNTDIYINGTKSNATATGTLSNVDDIGVNSQNVTIGGEADLQDFFQGKLDDIKIYPYARSATQNKKEHASGQSGQSSSNSNSNFGSNSLKNSTDGLVGYWKFDESIGSSSIDSSNNGQTATFGTGNSSPSWVVGKYGVGVSFDKNNDYISTPLHVSTWESKTYSAWIYLKSYQLWGMLVMDASAYNSNTYSGIIQYAGQKVYLSQNLSSGSPLTLIQDNLDLPYNQWVHVAGTIDKSTGVMRIYMNGRVVKESRQDMSGLTFGDTSNNIKIGGGNGGATIDGSMDEVRVYNRALSPDEVNKIYQYAPGPIAHYKLDEKTGTSASDNSGNGNNSTTWSGTNTWTTGKYGSALNFNNNDGVVRFAQSSTTSNIGSSDSYTIETWFKTSDTSASTDSLVAKHGINTGASPFRLYLSATTRTAGFTLTDGTNTRDVTGTVSLNDNQWHHLAGVRDFANDSVYLYVDGILVDTDTDPTTSSLVNSYDISIGNARASYTTDDFNGDIDDVRIYNYARTTNQIVEDMKSGADPKNAVLWYKFDEGKGTTANNSGIGGTINGSLGSGASTPTWTTGKSNGGLSFDGNSDFIQVADNSGLNLTGSFSISTWVKPQALPQFTCILERGTSITSRYYIWLGYEDVLFGVNNDFSSYNANLTIGEWAYITVVHNSETDTDFVYKNGKLVGSNTGRTTDPNTTGILRIGQPTNVTYQGAYFTNGQLDEVKIHNYALSADDVKNDYNQSSSFNFGSSNQTIGSTITSLEYCVPGDTTTCLPPVAEYKFDEGTGTTAFDTSGNSNHARLYNSPTWQSGKLGKSVLLNGSNTYIGATDSTTLRLGNAGTVETWINPKTLPTSGWKVLLSHGNWGGGRNFYSIYMEGTSSTFRFDVGGSSSYTSISSIPLSKSPLNTWTHLTLSWNSTTIYAYINGVLSGQSANIHTPDTSLAYDLNLGSIGGTYTFDGALDNVRIYNYTRTPAQIAYDYDKGKPISWYKLDECQGSIVYDSSGNGKNGTVTIGASGYQTTTGTCNIGTSAAWTTASTAKFNSGLSLDGTDDYVGIGNTTTIEGSTEATVCTWLKYRPSSVTTDGALVSRYLGSTGGWIFWVDDDAALGGHSDTVSFAPRPGDGDGGRVEGSTGLVTPGQWDHYCGVFKGGNYIRLYKNGKLDSEQTSGVSSTVGSDNANLYLGRVDNASPQYLDGQIDDVRIYSYALNSSQIKAVFNGSAINFK